MIGSLVGERIDLEAGAAGREGASGVMRPRGLDRPTDLAATDSYRAFLEAHLDEAYRLATFILGRGGDAEDAVHDAAISAWRHWSDRRDASRTEAWFRRIVVNACRDRLRSARRVQRIAATGDLTPEGDAFVPDHADRVGEQDHLGRLLASLPVDDRVLLTLRFGLDLTVPTIAVVLGLRQGTVKSRLHRAIASVRTYLAMDRGEDRP